MRRMDSIEKLWARKKLPKFGVGDTVEVHVRIVEGEKERVQIFSGTVLARRGGGATETFTVRRIVAGEGVERIFPLHSPRVADVKVTRRGRVRRAKLHYLRDRVGRATKVAEAGVKAEKETPPVEAPEPEAPAPQEQENEAEAPAKK